MPMCVLRLLGTFTLQTPSAARRVSLGRKGRALLACVAVHGDAGVSRARLVSLLWPDHGDEDARNALRQCLHQVRRALGEAAEGLDSEGDALVLHAPVWDVDVRRFEVLARASDLESMVAAADLYRGDFVEDLDVGCDFAHWAHAERQRLRDVACGLVTRLSERANVMAATEAAVRLARRLLGNDPVHEGCYRALMRLHAQAGLRAKALQVWTECQQALRRELGVAPSAETAAVIEQLLPRAEAASAAGGQGGPATVLSAVTATPTITPPRADDDAIVFDLLLRGWQLFSLFTAEANAQARTAFEVAISHVSDHAEAIAMLGWTHWFDSVSGWSADPGLSYGYASQCATRAIACNRGHPAPHAIQGKVLLWRMEHEAALEQLRHAVSIAPASAYAHFNLGDASMWCGRCDEALAHLDRALKLDPNDHGVFLTIQGKALWMSGDLRRAQAALESAITRNPGYGWAYGALATVLAERGDLEGARDAAVTARRLNRRFSLSFAERVLPYRSADQRRRVVEAWRAAGMPQHEAPGGRSVGSCKEAWGIASS
jgi:DNA-binding SARP family transcriptional activator